MRDPVPVSTRANREILANPLEYRAIRGSLMFMMSKIRKALVALVAVAASAALTSCYYDPSYYSGSASSVPSSYNSGSGYGYGYGGSGFSTSFFVSTGDPRWGYDPYCYSYYDYRRRCYYDPYLHGYYPVGYRPPVVVGCPHPYGYRRGYCPPPRGIRNVTVVGYRDRVGAYRRSDYKWARNVRPSRPQAYSGNTRSGGRVDQYGRGDRGRQNVRPNSRAVPQRGAGANRSRNSRTRVEMARSPNRGTRTTSAVTRTNRQRQNANNAVQTRNNAKNRSSAPRGRQEINRNQRGGGNPRQPQRQEQQRGGTSDGRQEIRYVGRG